MDKDNAIQQPGLKQTAHSKYALGKEEIRGRESLDRVARLNHGAYEAYISAYLVCVGICGRRGLADRD